MKVVRLQRISTSDHGTFGILLINTFWCYTLELPWRDNQSNFSCIPKGKYYCEIRKSPKYGKIYEVTEVEDRSHILIHAGNWGGDVTKGFKSNINGCILLGSKRGKDNRGQQVIWNSGSTVKKFMATMNKKPFILNIGGV